MNQKLKTLFNAVANEFSENLGKDVFSVAAVGAGGALLGIAPFGTLAACIVSGISAYRVAEGIYKGLKAQDKVELGTNAKQPKL